MALDLILTTRIRVPTLRLKIDSETALTKHKEGRVTTQLTKDAFVFEQVPNCFLRPLGQRLQHREYSTKQLATGPQTRDRYTSEPSVCAACPLRAKCLSAQSQHRAVNCYEQGIPDE